MGKLRRAPAQYTTDNDAFYNPETLANIANISKARVSKAADYAFDQATLRGEDPAESDEVRIIAEIRDRKSMLEAEQARLRTLFRRLDRLYYPPDVTTGGPDHWPEGAKPGREHISVNSPPAYVDIPASLQAVSPVENYIADGIEQADRDQASRAEHLYFAWQDDIEFDLLVHKACVVKGLYGFTYGKVYWDAIAKRPTVSLIDSPENLYVGWGASDFSRMDWTIYCYGISPQAAQEDFGLSVTAIEEDGAYFPLVTAGDHSDPIGSIFKRPGMESSRNPSQYEQMQVEVYDYWYKKPGPKKKKGEPSKAEIWNAIYVGNALVKNKRHAEYDDIPYLILPNTYIPGSPYGRPLLYDIEQLIREKDERFTGAAQMLKGVTDGQLWQLVGPEAPDDVPSVPKPNKVYTPGPGNELKAIQPFVAEYAFSDFMKELDKEMEVISGLNELLLGRAPATILGSSKAIAALVANYEARIKMPRDLLYQWRKRIWQMAAKVWETKDSEVRAIIDGNYRLDVQPPELTPRDELETANKELNLVQNRIHSMRRAMDATGVEDPEEELRVIREEQTDAALNPAAVQSQATLLSLLRQLGMAPQEASVEQAQNAARSLNRPASGGQSLNAEENQSNAPAEATPGNAQAPNGAKALSQTLLQGGEASGRVITQEPI